MDDALAIAQMALEKNVDGLIVSNTTIDRQGILARMAVKKRAGFQVSLCLMRRQPCSARFTV